MGHSSQIVRDAGVNGPVFDVESAGDVVAHFQDG